MSTLKTLVFNTNNPECVRTFMSNQDESKIYPWLALVSVFVYYAWGKSALAQYKELREQRRDRLRNEEMTRQHDAKYGGPEAGAGAGSSAGNSQN